MTGRDEQWGSCPEGLIADMVGGMRRRQQRRQLGSAIGVGGLLACLAVAFMAWPDVPQGDITGKLSCREVVQYFDAYHAGTLDAPTRLRVDRHFEECPGCRKKYDEIYDARAGFPVPSPQGQALLALAGARH